MHRVDGYYLYQFGHRLHRLSETKTEFFSASEGAVTKRLVLNELRPAAHALNEFLHSSVFDLRISVVPGQALSAALQEAIALCERCTDEDETLKWDEFTEVRRTLSEFEAVLKAELGRLGMFLVAPKSALDTSLLIEAGHLAFPPELATKVPSAISDAKQAMSCIAFELPTAAAFHLHRANEAVLKAYFEATAPADTHLPEKGSMGTIVHQMEQQAIGKEEIRSSLRDIIRLHRNPTIHPETSLDDVEEAINLYGAIRSVIGFMLKEIQPLP